MSLHLTGLKRTFVWLSHSFLDKPELTNLECLLCVFIWIFRYFLRPNSLSQILQTWFLSFGSLFESCSSSRCLWRSNFLKKKSLHKEHFRCSHSPLAMCWCRSYGELTFNLQCLHSTGPGVPTGGWWRITFS